MTAIPAGSALYTKEADGTIQRWYIFGWYGDSFSVSTRKNAKLRDFKRYFKESDIGVKIFLSRKEAVNG